jgi:hypothetical protein
MARLQWYKNSNGVSIVMPKRSDQKIARIECQDSIYWQVDGHRYLYNHLGSDATHAILIVLRRVPSGASL